jgi:divalent metal cation (Fe/Co/Zn/Cd) transporter
VPRVREIHNLNVVTVDGSSAVSLHLKLPGDLSLEEAHAVANEVERAIEEALPEVESVQTHLEPLAEETEGSSPAARDVDRYADTVLRVVDEATGRPPRALRFLHTADGLVAFLTLGLDPKTPLAEAHARASEIEERIRRERPDIAEIIVHTEP